MLGDEENQARRFGFLSSPVVLATLARGGCVAMMLAPVGGALAATATSITRSPSPVLYNATSHLTLDFRLAFALLFGGFIIMAGVAFVLSRRSFRDALTTTQLRKINAKNVLNLHFRKNLLSSPGSYPFKPRDRCKTFSCQFQINTAICGCSGNLRAWDDLNNMRSEGVKISGGVLGGQASIFSIQFTAVTTGTLS